MLKSLIFLFCFFSIASLGQIKIKARIVDADTKEGLAFVNIGVKVKNVGTVSNENGFFEILIPESNALDKLTFSLIGYYELDIPISKLKSEHQEVFALKVKPSTLPQVDIVSDRLKENRYGIKKLKPTIRFVDASVNHEDIFEIAQKIDLGNNTSKITSVNLLINQPNADTGIFRINFYGYDGQKPTVRLVEKNIVIKQPVKSGWLKFDLTKEGIYLKGNVVVAIEFIPDKKGKAIQYEVKVGGTSKSFVRSSSLGLWTTPPHHYRLFVTALSSQIKPNVEEEDDLESLPTLKYFSKNVQDTFSIFIKEPSDYKKNSNQAYPVVFLLDANVYFDIVSGSINHLKDKPSFLNPILIGIGYKNVLIADSLRDRDYTYPNALVADSFLVSGGAWKFLDFIEKELIPFIDNKYRTNPDQRTLMGHSLGGYFTLYALEENLKKHSHLFKNYVAASPSLEYCNSYLITRLNELSNNLNEIKSINLLLTTGALEDGEDGSPAFKAFINELKTDKLKGVHLDHFIFPNTEHMGTAIPSFEMGLEIFLK